MLICSLISPFTVTYQMLVTKIKTGNLVTNDKQSTNWFFSQFMQTWPVPKWNQHRFEDIAEMPQCHINGSCWWSRMSKWCLICYISVDHKSSSAKTKPLAAPWFRGETRLCSRKHGKIRLYMRQFAAQGKVKARAKHRLETTSDQPRKKSQCFF